VIYLAAYFTCIWVLIRRSRQGCKWHIISSTILFTLSSLQVFLLIPIFRFAIIYAYRVAALDDTIKEDSSISVTSDPELLKLQLEIDSERANLSRLSTALDLVIFMSLYGVIQTSCTFTHLTCYIVAV
jgi:hypothetical protein